MNDAITSSTVTHPYNITYKNNSLPLTVSMKVWFQVSSQWSTLFLKMFTEFKSNSSACFSHKVWTHTLLTCSTLNVHWTSSGHFLFSWLLLLIILPGCKTFLWWCMLLTGELSVFYACFSLKIWTLFKLSILTCFRLNIPWTYFQYLIFRLLLTVIIVPRFTRFF